MEQKNHTYEARTFIHKFKRFIVKSVLSIIAFFIVLVVGIIVALQIPSVQTFLAQKASKKASELLGFEIKIKKLSIDWIDEGVVLRGLQIKDKQKNVMIGLDKVGVDVSFFTMLSGGNVYLDKVTLSDGEVNLLVDKKSELLNISEFIAKIEELTSSKSPKKNKKSSVVKIAIGDLKNINFTYSDARKDSIVEGFDFIHFTVDSLNAHLKDFLIVGDTIEFQAEKLRGIDRKTKLNVKEITTLFRITKSSMEFNNLLAHVNNTIIRKNIIFSFKSMADMSDFVNKVNIKADLDNTIIYTQDLALFAPPLKVYEDIWKISGNYKGTVSNFSLRNMNLAFGKTSYLKGYASFAGLPNFSETFITLKSDQALIATPDLQQYIDNDTIFKTVSKLGDIHLKGRFDGFPKDFVAAASIKTDVGNIYSDINLKMNENSSYEGKLTTENFNVGKLLDMSDIIQTIDMDGTLKGRGFDVNNANLVLKAQIHKLGLYNYDYEHIDIDGTLDKKRFEGEIYIQDPNADLAVLGTVDFNKNVINEQQGLPTGAINLNISIENLSLKPLNLSPVETILKGQIVLNTYGLKVDDIVGEGSITNAYVFYDNQDLFIDSIAFYSQKNEGDREFQFNSDFITLSAQGKFEFTQLGKGIQTLIQEYRLAFENNKKSQHAYYSKKHVYEIFDMTFGINLKNINPILNLFLKKVYIPENTAFQGKFANGAQTILTLKTAKPLDSIIYDKYALYKLDLDINTAKQADSSNVQAYLNVSSTRQKFGGITPTQNLKINADWNQNVINFQSNIEQADTTNSIQLAGHVTFHEGYTALEVDSSQFRIADDIWQFSANNPVTWSPKAIRFDQLEFYKDDQKIIVDGAIADSTSNEKLEVFIQNFDLIVLKPFISKEINGLVNGYVSLEDIYRQLKVKGEIDVEELVVDKFLIGDILATSGWDNKAQKLDINVDLHRKGNYIFNVAGTYAPQEPENQLNMVADLIETDLEILAPFVKEYITDLQGTARGKISIKGKASAPLLAGIIDFKYAGLRVNFLGSKWYFSDRVYIAENEISVKRLKLEDEDQNTAFLKGGIFHDGFKNMVVDVSGKFNKFQVMNTTEKVNKTYYGTVYTTGNLEIQGAFTNLLINGNVKTEKGTEIFVPLDSYEETSTRSYIEFVDFEDLNKNLAGKLKKTNLNGIKLNLALDITPDANMELIFDRTTGDALKVRGSGKIRMDIDTRGEFRMFGEYAIQEGTYQITLIEFVTRKFNIREGSKISFNGDLYSGELDVKAGYDLNIQLTSLIDLSTVPDPQNPDYTRKYPVSVVATLQGALLTPNIKLSIDLKDLQRVRNSILSAAALAFQNSIANNEQELNKQAFSLILFKRFAPDNSFLPPSTGGSAQGSLGKLLSSQLANWMSGIDENLEVTMDVEGTNSSAVRLQVAYSFLGGRLRVSRNGLVEGQGSNSTSNMVGEWTVEYLLSPDGRYRLKMYNKNLTNTYSGAIGNSTTVAAGFSFMHTQTFNKFKEIFQPRKQAQQQQERLERQNARRKEEEEEYNKGDKKLDEEKKPEEENKNQKKSEEEKKLDEKNKKEKEPASKPL